MILYGLFWMNHLNLGSQVWHVINLVLPVSSKICWLITRYIHMVNLVLPLIGMNGSIHRAKPVAHRPGRGWLSGAQRDLLPLNGDGWIGALRLREWGPWPDIFTGSHWEYLILVGGVQHVLLFHIIIPADYFFFRGVETTNQLLYLWRILKTNRK